MFSSYKFNCKLGSNCPQQQNAIDVAQKACIVAPLENVYRPTFYLQKTQKDRQEADRRIQHKC